MIAVQTQDFSAQSVYDELRERARQSGAIVAFVGIVREFADDKSIHAMTLQHYPGMTESALQKIADEAHTRWRLDAETIIHRVGKLRAGEQIVVAAAAAAHRKNAFQAVEFMMDYLKTDAPFWKKEHTDKGEHWVQSRAADADARKRWGGDDAHC